MSDVMQDYPHLNDLSQPALHQRYQQLKERKHPLTGAIDDDTLKELIVLARILRGRASAPTAKPKGGGTAKNVPTLDSL